VATGVVLVIVAITKFLGGAWIVISAMPVLVGFFLLVHRHYAAVARELSKDRVRFGDVAANHTVLVVTEFDAAAAEALGYVHSLRPDRFDVLYVGDRPREDAEARWAEMAPGASTLIFSEHRDRVDGVIDHLRGIRREQNDFITVVIPELFHQRSLMRAVLRPVTFRLKLRLLTVPQVVIADVPVVAEEGSTGGIDGRSLIPARVVALVFVSAPHDAAVRAINYARALNAHEVRAVFLATEPEEVPEVLERWADRGIGIQLDVVEVPFRDLGPPLLKEVRRVTGDGDTVAAVVLPEFLVTRWWHRILHNNRALFIKRVLLFEPRVILSSVPYQLGRSDGSG
jgi:hypothetical protein